MGIRPIAQAGSGTVPDATAGVKGKLLLAGDLGGTATAPTVPGLAAKADTTTGIPAVDLRAKGADPTGAVSATSVHNAANATLTALGGGIVDLGPGTYAFADSSLAPVNGVTLRGVGIASVIKATAAAGGLVFAGNLNKFALLDFTVDCTGIVQPIYLVGCHNFHLRLKMTNLTGIGVTLDDCEDFVLEIEGEWPSNNNVPPTLIRTTNCKGRIVRPTISCHTGVALDLRNSEIEVVEPALDGRWFVVPARYSNSGGAVTYPTLTTLTDTSAPLTGASPAISAGSTIRSMPVRVASTSATTYEARRVLKTGATFVTNGVLEGDIIEVGSVWSMVLAALDETTLAVEGWRNKTDSLPAATPTSGNFTVYRTLVSRVVSIAGNTITHGTFCDLYGTDITPAAGTRYDIGYNKGSHLIIGDDQCRSFKMTGGYLRRGWGDMLDYLGTFANITGTLFEFGQDIGCGLEGGWGHSAVGITTRRNGSMGVWAEADSVVSGLFLDDGWYNFDTNLGMVTVVGNRVKVSGRFIRRNLTRAKWPVIVRAYSGAVDKAHVVDIHATGFSVADVGLYPETANVTNTKVASLSDVSSVAGVGTVTGTTIPGSRFAAGSLAAPSISFAADPDSGFYQPYAGRIDLVLDGDAKFVWDGNSLYVKGTPQPLTDGGANLGSASVRWFLVYAYQALLTQGLGVWGHAAPGTQPATAVTLGDVIAVLQAYGLCA